MNKVVELYRDGVSITEISRRLKYSVFVINRILRDNGIIKKKPQPIPDHVVVDFVGHVALGGSMKSFSLESGFGIYRLKKAAEKRLAGVDIDMCNEVAEAAKNNLELGLTIKQAFKKALKELPDD